MNKLRTFVKENTFLKRDNAYGSDFGWGNGYVIIPKGHKLHGMSYGKIHDLIPLLECNGGLTFSSYAVDLKDWAEITEDDKDCWTIGFDTCHSWDSLESNPMGKVKLTTIKLRDHIEHFIKNNKS